MWAFVGLTFVVMLFLPDARWNAITTVWGALFLGLLISLVLEQRGEGIQRRVWLSQNTERARTTVDELLAVAASAAFAVDLPSEILQALMSGATRSARRQAAGRARAHIWSRMQLTPEQVFPAADRRGRGRALRSMRRSAVRSAAPPAVRPRSWQALACPGRVVGRATTEHRLPRPALGVS